MSVTQFGIINTCWFEYAECTLTIPTYVGVDPWGFVEWREVLCDDFLANYCTLCTKINTIKGVAIWSPFTIPLCAISTKIFTCVSQTSGTIRHAFLRTSGQEGSFFFFR